MSPAWTTFDLDAALSKLDGDIDTLRELAQIFIECQGENWDAIVQAAQNQDARALQLNAHRMKSSVANFFARATYSAAAELERVGRESDWHKLPSSQNELQQALEKLLPELTRFSQDR